MNEKVLVQYLQDIVNLESQKRIAGKTYNQLTIEEKDRRRSCEAYSSNEGNYSVIKQINREELIKTIIVYGFLGMMIGGVIGWILIFSLYKPSEISEKTMLPAAVICWITMIGGIVWGIRKEVAIAKDSVRTLEKSYIRYGKEAERNKVLLPKIEQDKVQLKQVYNQCEENLKKLYALDIIHSKYQYFEACGMFLEYISTGRTHSLEQNHGDTGAYNLFEQDLKFNVIKNQLEEVLSNQRILYHELSEINSKVENLSSSVRNIEQYARQTAVNTKISAWCNAVTAVNVNALRRMQEEYYYYR